MVVFLWWCGCGCVFVVVSCVGRGFVKCTLMLTCCQADRALHLDWKPKKVTVT